MWPAAGQPSHDLSSWGWKSGDDHEHNSIVRRMPPSLTHPNTTTTQPDQQSKNEKRVP